MQPEKQHLPVRLIVVTSLVLLFIAVLALLARQATSPSTQPGAVDPTRTPTLTMTATRTPTALAPTATPTSVPSPISTPTRAAFLPLAVPREWVQDAHDAQRTGYSPNEPLGPWKLLWTWNGPDETGASGGHFYDAPPEARTITGGDFVYVPAGEEGLFALRKSSGIPGWQVTGAAFNVTPAYDHLDSRVYAGSADGLVYQISAETGEILQTYEAGSPVDKSILLAQPYVFAVTGDGSLHKISTANMQADWVYHPSQAASASTPPALSYAAGVLVYATEDLFVHAVDAEDGSLRWSVKPTLREARPPFTFHGYWPVIAEQTGIVFLRLSLGMDGLWSGPGEGGKYPHTNAEIRAYLQDNPQWQNLFALDLQTGEPRFIPAVGPGGVEDLRADGAPELAAGSAPVVRTFEDGTEVAYMLFRSGQTQHPDGRWDSHLGEMVLDDQTFPEMQAGDLRFIHFSNSYVHITDEQSPLSMAGDTIFHAHWGASESTRLTDRSYPRGLTPAEPILSRPHPVIIRRMQACSDFNPASHWTTCGLTLFEDGRYWNGPGWWVYWNQLDPPTPSRRAYSEGILPRYTYASDGLVIVQGNGGELMVFSHQQP